MVILDFNSFNYMLFLLLLIGILTLLLMWYNMKRKNRNPSKGFTIRSFFDKTVNIIQFFYNNPLLLLYFLIVLFGLVNGLNWGYFEITGFSKEFNIFMFIHKQFTIYPFIVVIPLAVLINLNPKIDKKPSLKEILFLGLDNVTFTGFILYVCIGLLYYYTGVHLIILAYFLPILVDLFANLPDIFVDFVKLHSLTRTSVSSLKISKLSYFSEVGYRLRNKVILNSAIGTRKTINSKFTPHVSLRSSRFLPSEYLILSNTAKALISKEVFRSPLSNIAISLVEKDIFKPLFLLRLSKCDNVAWLELMVVQANKLTSRSLIDVKCSKNGKSFLDNFENNTSMFYAQQGKFNQTLIVHMQREFSYGMGNIVGSSNTPNTSGVPNRISNVTQNPSDIIYRGNANQVSQMDSYSSNRSRSNAGLPDKSVHYTEIIGNKMFLINELVLDFHQSNLVLGVGHTLYDFKLNDIKIQIREVMNMYARAYLWANSFNQSLKVLEDTASRLACIHGELSLDLNLKTLFHCAVEQKGKMSIVDPYHYWSDSDNETNLDYSQTQWDQSGVGLDSTTAEAGPYRPVLSRTISLNERVSSEGSENILRESSDAMSVGNPFEQENSTLTIQNIAASQSTGLTRRSSIIGDNSNLFNNKFKYPLNNEAMALFTMDTTISLEELTNNLARYKENTEKKWLHRIKNAWAGEEFREYKAKLFQTLAENQDTDAWKLLTEDEKEGDFISCNFARLNITNRLLILLRSIYLEQIDYNLIGNNSNLFNGKFKYPLIPSSVELFTMDSTIFIR